MINQSGGSFETMVSTLITTYIIQKFSLNNLYYGIIFGLIVHVIKKYNDVENFNINDNILSNILSNIWLLIIGAIIYLLYRYRDNIYNFFKIRINTEYVTLKLYRKETINILTEYTKLFPQYFDRVYSLEYGNPSYECHKFNKDVSNYSYARSELNTIDTDSKVYFNIVHKNIRGYIKWELHNDEIIDIVNDKERKQKSELKYPVIYIEKTCLVNGNDLFKLMTDELEDINANSLTLFNTKIYGYDKNILDKRDFKMYDGKKKSIEEKEKIYMDTFFHKEKERLWSTIKNIHFNPDLIKSKGQSPQMNLLLYGPPGSGKSSFAYRVAMCLDRHIINLDIRDIKSRKMMYSILKSPSVNAWNRDPNECVFVFEEFDISIKQLIKENNIIKQKVKAWEERIEKYNVVDYKHSSSSEEYETIDDKDIDDDKNDKNDNKKKKQIKPKNKRKKYGNGSYYTPELYINKDAFLLNDLLDIFQGTVPNNGSIIIATTNNYEEIKSTCGALFRPGRLTPVYFGYANKEILQQMSRFYFKQDLTIDIPNEINIPTSQIIEIALEATSIYDISESFPYFSIKLEDLFKNH